MIRKLGPALVRAGVFFWALLLVGNRPCAAGESSFETAGDVLQVLLPATGFSAALYLHDGEGQKQFLKSFAVNLGTTLALKYSIDKPRPEGHGGQSFPSGHSSSAFQGATFIQRRYGWRYGVPAYLAATYVGWSRVEGESDKHDVVDVLAGAGIGYLSSWLFTTPYHNLQISVVATPDSQRLAISGQW
ncbi:PAP2 family protein [Geothermobacter hydrogeniphilus]|uniref:PAP2 family protein n=1 Tax=Geothermobacter hydrogeniphilus TaxID=1969733 RepID=A0A2K2H5S2_9BACT|nr:phosphatase PAP2 family protein [Geothermobacter hydrogeniphilus]PNU18580.1 PAP2 family protein [Geothermobacter hydrogeniphilus]